MGHRRIDCRDGAAVVGAGEMCAVPKGVGHKPFAAKVVKLPLIEPRGVRTNGGTGGGRTEQNDVWV